MEYIPTKEMIFMDYGNRTDEKIFYWRNRLFIGLSHQEGVQLDHLNAIGLMDELQSAGLIPTLRKSLYKSAIFDLIFEYTTVSSISVIAEWTFDMMKAAASSILELLRIIVRHNFTLQIIDSASIVLNAGFPIFLRIDLVKKINDSSQVKNTHELFFEYLLYPLLVWNKINTNVYHRMFGERFFDKTPREFVCSSMGQGVDEDIMKNKNVLDARGNIDEVLTTIDITEKLVQNLARDVVTTEWSNYHDFYVVKDEYAASDRFKIILNKINQLNIKTATELAGNWGLFSSLMLQHTGVQSINCSDFDEMAVNKMFNVFQSERKSKLLSPIWLDIMNPIEYAEDCGPGFRFRAQAVIALAVTHHLILTFDYEIRKILKMIGQYTTEYVIMEFMPLGLWNGGPPRTLPSFYTLEWFDHAFREFFSVLEVVHIEEESRVRLVYIGRKLI